MARGRQLLPMILGTALLAAACGGAAAPTAGPTASAAPVASQPGTVPPTAAPPTAVVTPAPPSEAPPTAEPQSAQPSAPPPTSGGSDLLSLIPIEAGPYSIQTQPVPAELIASYMPGIEDVLTTVGATPADASLVLAGATGSGITDSVAIYALRVAGADSEQLVQAEVDRWLGQMVEGSQATQVTIGGKDVIQVGEQDPSFPKYAKYVYAVGDVVFVLDQAGNDAVIEEVLSALP